MRKRYKLTFPPAISREPIVYHLVKDFDLMPNILRSQIQPGCEGVMLLELTGTADKLVAAEQYLRDQKMVISPAAADIEHNDDLCVDCGLCASVCRQGALSLDALGALVINRDLCVLCEVCVSTCPRRAIKLVF
ncbi:MAG: 4Fe-4S binding protein [Actinobacteria bacterium]|nr:4Fe-4S binding protein [Actinomycetota bacterium]